MPTTLKGTIWGGVTFSVSEAVQKEKDFIVTAQYRDHNSSSSVVDETWWSCGFGTAYDPVNDNIKIGSITPQEIDGFKILNLQDQGWSTTDLEDNPVEDVYWILLEANHKCILHINGKDYNVTEYKDGIYHSKIKNDQLGIEDKEQIKVTYTLL